MRLLITRRLVGSVDGVQLSRFQVGWVYEVGTLLGSYLLCDNAAVPADGAPVNAAPGQQVFSLYEHMGLTDDEKGPSEHSTAQDRAHHKIRPRLHLRKLR
jgi:hypothetical protein